jgi:hypothetical protein
MDAIKAVEYGIASPFARERGRVRVGSIEATLLAGTPHLYPLPSGKGEAVECDPFSCT